VIKPNLLRENRNAIVCVVQEAQHTNQDLSIATFRILKVKFHQWKLCRRGCNRTTQRSKSKEENRSSELPHPDSDPLA